ncbi:MAG: DNA polymerase III subunit gamma/tau [Phycisphaerae bacterium]
MSYRVLARAYRSNTFDEVVGQEAVATTLKNAITSGRIHHGYVFTGTRGVGKTSMARILAKSLNCLESDGPTVSPCCQCDSCQNVAAGEDVDVVEIDAASNNGVDHIRDLRSNAGFRPARSRYKVYIVDEVHMLSKAAFNALLKTLEEPPEHVKFIMATTEPEKVPATIKSRCQNFDFRAISAEKIGSHLAEVLEQENVEADEYVVRRIARLANGSMRDGLSLLDQLLSYESKKLTAEVVDLVIPPSHDEHAAAIMEAVANSDPAQALLSLDAALQTGRTVERLCDHLIEHVRALMLMKICGQDTELVDVPAQLRGTLYERSQSFDSPTYVFMISLLEELRRNARSEAGGRALADAAVVRLAMSQKFSSIGDLIERLESGQLPAGAPALPVAEKKKLIAEVHPPAAVNPAPQPSTTTAAPPAPVASAPTAPPPAAPTQAAPAPAEVPPASPPQPALSDDTEPRRYHTDYSEGDINPPSDYNSEEQTAETARPEAMKIPDAGALSSEEWQKAARDPLVMKVRDAVDGTLFDIRPAARPATANTESEDESQEPT